MVIVQASEKKILSPDSVIFKKYIFGFPPISGNEIIKLLEFPK